MVTHVLCFSKTGNTRRVCARVADRLGVALQEIRCPDIRPGVWGYLSLGWAALTGKLLRIEAPALSFGPDDLLVLGAPVWAGRVAVPMTTWLDNRTALPSRIGIVMTSGQSSRPNESFDRFAHAIGKTPAATLHVAEKDAKAGAFDAGLDSFIGKLTAAP